MGDCVKLAVEALLCKYVRRIEAYPLSVRSSPEYIARPQDFWGKPLPAERMDVQWSLVNEARINAAIKLIERTYRGLNI